MNVLISISGDLGSALDVRHPNPTEVSPTQKNLHIGLANMHVVIIGGTGHIGTYLIPRLVDAGHDVTCVSRQLRQAYRQADAWEVVRQINLDRTLAEAAGTFGIAIRRLRPDVVIDLICYLPTSARALVEALDGSVGLLISCGTNWVHGHSKIVPTTEDQPRAPLDEYGIRKAEIEAYLIGEATKHGFPSTILHPGHITGPGWAPINPAGNKDPRVFSRLFRGEEVALPHFGMETLHHIHADDVSQAFMLAITQQASAIGESFYIGSPAALTLRGYAEAVAGWAGRTANLRFLSWDAWAAVTPAKNVAHTWNVLNHSANFSSAKAARLLGYAPRYSSLQAIKESVDWLINQKIIEAIDQ